MGGPALFDTSAVIGLTERRSPALVAIVKALGGPITRSITVAGELGHGAELASRPNGRDRQRTLDRYARLSQWSDHEVGLDELSHAYGRVSAIAGSSSIAVGSNDRWIIAECIVQGTSLVTSDRRQAELAEQVPTLLDVVVAD